MNAEHNIVTHLQAVSFNLEWLMTRTVPLLDDDGGMYFYSNLRSKCIRRRRSIYFMRSDTRRTIDGELSSKWHVAFSPDGRPHVSGWLTAGIERRLISGDSFIVHPGHCLVEPTSAKLQPLFAVMNVIIFFESEKSFKRIIERRTGESKPIFYYIHWDTV